VLKNGLNLKIVEMGISKMMPTAHKGFHFYPSTNQKHLFVSTKFCNLNLIWNGHFSKFLLSFLVPMALILFQ
jgi:hypothetical protein